MKPKPRRASTLELHHFVEFKGTVVGVIFDMVYHRAYPATRHSPSEPAHWEVTGFQMEDGWDHLEGYVGDKLDDPYFMDEICDLANQEAEGTLERWRHGNI
jgi:hypothetical protein